VSLLPGGLGYCSHPLTITPVVNAGVRGGAGEQVDVILDLPALLSFVATASGATSGSGSGSDGGNATSASTDAQRQALVAALLRAAGIDLANTRVTVNGLVALETALAVAGLGNTVNITDIARQFPGLDLITIDLTPLLAGALVNAANALVITNTYTV